MSKSKFTGRLLQSSILAGAAVAFAAPAFAQDDEIVVTGTRIQRADLEAPSPVTSVGEQELNLSNTVNTEQFLNSLPQAIPGFDSASNNPGNGAATANLRGLGTVRTLVLVDGKRYVGFDTTGRVDLNSVPAALVERIDVVTGGASAVYGSDAMAGVVNFILKDDFEGFEIDTSYEVTEESDGQIFDINLTMGGNFADGRGNAVLSIGYTDREDVFASDRDFSSFVAVDSGTGNGFGFGGSSGVPGTRAFGSYDFTVLPGYTPGATNCMFGGQPVEGLSAACIGTAGFNQDGTPFPFDSGTAITPTTDFYNYAPVNYLQLPQERFNIASFASYDINEDVTAKGRVVFTSNKVPQQLAPTPFFGTVTINSSNPNLTPEFIALIGTDGGFDAMGNYQQFIGRRMVEIGPRISDQELRALQIGGGLEGTFSNGWDWELYGHFNRGTGDVIQSGNVSISAFQAALDSGMCDIFGAGQYSQACVSQIARTGAALTEIESTNLIASVNGDLSWTLPSAQSPIQFAAGVEYREEFGDFKPDSVLGPDVSGFNQALPISGRFDTAEIFGELYIPVVEGASWAEEFSVNGAYRYSDYSTVGGVNAFAVGAEWAPNSQIRFRAQYQEASRAPNISELFSPVVNGFPGAVDPCAGPNPTGTQALCTANGVPAAAFGSPNLQPNSQIQGLFGGNANLSEETAETVTIGFVAQPEAIPGLTLTVDYYDIEIEDIISTAPINVVLNGCYVSGVQSFCSLINRRATGSINFVSLNNQNLALATSEGVDITGEYEWEWEDYDFVIDYTGGFKLESGFQPLEGQPFVDCAGYFGANAGVCLSDDPVPEYKHTVRFDAARGDWLASLRWRYISEVEADDLIGGGPSGLFVDTVDAYNYLDFSGQVEVNETVTLSAGITNLTDEDPPILGDCCSEQSNTYPSTYETLGRTYFVGAKLSF